jgi:lipoprotein-anchoring transpeptidase ErfK/SrfK
MKNVSWSRGLGRTLTVAVAVMVTGGLLTDAWFWHRSTDASHRIATAAAKRHPVPASPRVPSPSPTSTAAPPIPVPTMSLVTDVSVRTIAVYGAPAVGKVLADVPDVNILGQTEALLVTDASVPGWYEVEVPVKPNGSQGWVQASDVTVRQDPYYIRVYQSRFRLELYKGGVLQKAFTVAVGAPSTPTPYGHFFVWASQHIAGPPYTPGIFALSAFSTVLENWPGGGRTGIHGWTDTSIIGTRASHGCVRLRPVDFAQLLDTVPLGTPVDILS